MNGDKWVIEMVDVDRGLYVDDFFSRVVLILNMQSLEIFKILQLDERKD